MSRSAAASWQRVRLYAYGRYRQLGNWQAVRRDRLDRRHLEMLLRWTLRHGSNCIDVGAHTGVVLRTCVELAPTGRHYAFEPLPSYAARLREQFPTVTVVEAAVYDTVLAKKRFHHFTATPALSGMTERPPRTSDPFVTIEVPQTTIDVSVPNDYRVDFLKIDVEGAELGVLRGAEATIAQSDPSIVVEFGQSGADHYGAGPFELLELLAAYELRLFDIDGAGPYSLRDLNERWNNRDLWNFVAHR